MRPCQRPLDLIRRQRENERMSIREKSQFIEVLTKEVSQVVVGQKELVEKLILALLCDGHVLLEGLPGLAKTLTVKTLAQAIDAEFNRIQFTPDLLPADLVGTMIFNQKTFEFTAKKGPIFTNIVLADEINRAPAKVQSALLEAMGERQVTIGETTYKLADPFIVLATQNPIEQEGTYSLPEAQLDRFLFKIKVGYPTFNEEREILDRMSKVEMPEIKPVCKPEDILAARKFCSEIFIEEKIKNYILKIVFATREPAQYQIPDIARLISVGASPRATIALTKAARAHAFIEHRDFVTPEDVKSVANDVLRHRLILNYEADAEGIHPEAIIKKILQAIEVP